jgi:hypothetical protein
LSLEAGFDLGKQRNRRNAERVDLFAFADQFIDTVALDARHRIDALARGFAIDDEHRVDQIGRVEPVLAHQPSRKLRATIPTQSRRWELSWHDPLHCVRRRNGTAGVQIA